jgi:hypothetical protein
MCFPSIAKNLLIVSAMIVPSADYGQHHEKNMKIFRWERNIRTGVVISAGEVKDSARLDVDDFVGVVFVDVCHGGVR